MIPVVREARASDIEGLLALARGGHFINLPDDRDALRRKIEISRASFRGTIADPKRAEFLLVLDDGKGGVAGSSAVIARHGTPEAPHVYFRTRKVEHWSRTLHAGFIHTTLTIEFMEDGPTELGGLVVDPSRRGSGFGRFLSLVRFLLIAAHREWFRPRLLAEMAAPIHDGTNPLWEAVGRPFTNMSFDEADALSRENKEFIEALFPRAPIYTALLPAPAREAIGKVAPAAEPARRLLEAAGMRFTGMIDPFDGGPHLWAATDEVGPIRRARRVVLAAGDPPPGAPASIVAFEPRGDDRFRAVRAPCAVEGEVARIPAEAAALGARPGDVLWTLPLA